MNQVLTWNEKQRLCAHRVNELKKRGPTKSEQILAEMFIRVGVRAMFQKGFIAGNNFCIADFYLPKHKLVVEVDGGYHTTDSQMRRDANKDWYYRQRNFKVWRMTNEEAEVMTENRLRLMLNEFSRLKR